MALTQVVVFAVLQGLSAIFPIGAATHLALLNALAGWSAENRILVVAGEAGVLLAVVAYFWRDLFEMAVGVARAFKGKRDPGARLALQIVVASIPALALGFFAERYLRDGVNSLQVIGWVTLGAALLLLLFDRMSMTVKRIEHATYIDAILVSLCQVLALLPGASRAGATVTMARFLGYERDEALRFSMLLAIPLLAAVLVKDLVAARDGTLNTVTRLDLFGAVVAFAVALVSVAMLMTWLKRATFTPFVVYRLMLGTAVVILAYGWIQI